MTLKVLLFSHEFPPSGGGAGVVAMQYYFSLVNQGYDVTLLSINVSDNNMKHINVGNKKHWLLSYALAVRKIDLNSFDLIILNDIGAAYIAGLFFKEKIINKCIMILHGQEPEQIYSNASLLYKIIGFKFIYNRVVRHTKKVIAVSYYMKSKFLSIFNYDKNLEKKIVVNYSSVSDLFKIKFLKDNIVRTSNKIKILTVSRMEKKKGYENTLAICERLYDHEIDFEWTIIGSGSFECEFRKIVNNSKIRNKIKIIGHVERVKLPVFYQKADVFILLSEYKESFGLVYIEAQMCGCPVIGYNRCGVKEAIMHNETGFLVNTLDDVFHILYEKKYKKLSMNDKCLKAFYPSEIERKLINIIEGDNE